METHSKVLLREGQAVRRMALEIVPDLFDGIKLGRIAWKPFDMEPWILHQNLPDFRPFVNLATVPKQDYGSLDMTEHCPQEFRDMLGLEVVPLEAGVNTHVFPPGGYGERSKCGYTVMAVTVVDNRGNTHWTPGTTARRNEQKPTLIEKGEVGAKFYSFF
jgi:hypothetical protein